MRTSIFAVLCLGTMLAAGSAFAQPSYNSCFYIRDFQNWKAPDARTIIIRVNLHDYYRLDLSGTCATLQEPGAHLITKTRGSDEVCSAIDWDLSVSDADGLRGPAVRQRCIVRNMTKLTDADVAALPPKFKP